eukprot:gene16851-18550_t
MTSVFVGSLPPFVDNYMLAREFSPFGDIKRVTVVRDRLTGMSRGFGYVVFYEEMAAAEAINAMDGQIFHGRPLSVSYPKTDQRKPEYHFERSRDSYPRSHDSNSRRDERSNSRRSVEKRSEERRSSRHRTSSSERERSTASGDRKPPESDKNAKRDKSEGSGKTEKHVKKTEGEKKSDDKTGSDALKTESNKSAIWEKSSIKEEKLPSKDDGQSKGGSGSKDSSSSVKDHSKGTSAQDKTPVKKDSTHVKTEIEKATDKDNKSGGKDNVSERGPTGGDNRTRTYERQHRHDEGSRDDDVPNRDEISGRGPPSEYRGHFGRGGFSGRSRPFGYFGRGGYRGGFGDQRRGGFQGRGRGFQGRDGFARGRGGMVRHAGPDDGPNEPEVFSGRGFHQGRGAPRGRGGFTGRGGHQEQGLDGPQDSRKPGLLGDGSLQGQGAIESLLGQQKPGLLGAAPVALVKELLQVSQGLGSDRLPLLDDSAIIRESKDNARDDRSEQQQRGRIDSDYEPRQRERNRSYSPALESRDSFRRPSDSPRSARYSQQPSGQLSESENYTRKRHIDSGRENPPFEGQRRYNDNAGYSDRPSRADDHQSGYYAREPSPKRLPAARQSADYRERYNDYRMNEGQRLDARGSREYVNDRRDTDWQGSSSGDWRDVRRDGDNYQQEYSRYRDVYGSDVKDYRETSKMSRHDERDLPPSGDRTQAMSAPGGRYPNRDMVQRDERPSSHASQDSFRGYQRNAGYQRMDGGRGDKQGDSAPAYGREESERRRPYQSQGDYGRSSSTGTDQPRYNDWHDVESKRPVDSSDYQRGDSQSRTAIRDQQGYASSDRNDKGRSFVGHASSYASGDQSSSYHLTESKPSDYQRRLDDSGPFQRQGYERDAYKGDSSMPEKASALGSSYRQSDYHSATDPYASSAKKRDLPENPPASQEPSTVAGAKRSRGYGYDSGYSDYRSSADNAASAPARAASDYEGRASSNYGSREAARPSEYSTAPSSSPFSKDTRPSTVSTYSAQALRSTDQDRRSYQQYSGTQAANGGSQEASQYARSGYVGYGGRPSQTQDSYSNQSSRYSSDQGYATQASSSKADATQKSQSSGYSPQQTTQREWVGYSSKSYDAGQKQPAQYDAYRRPAGSESSPVTSRGASDTRSSEQTDNTSQPWQQYDKTDAYKSTYSGQTPPGRYASAGRPGTESYDRGSYSSTSQSPAKTFTQQQPQQQSKSSFETSSSARF